MVFAAHEILRTNPNPSADQIRHGLEGNMCRCTGYQNIVRAVQAAAADPRSAGIGGRR
jgi:carbon-monoxide dehydrogenase small subunit